MNCFTVICTGKGCFELQNPINESVKEISYILQNTGKNVFN